MGEMLAKKILNQYGDNLNIDVIIPIPETSRNSAMECAKRLNRPYCEGFVKNRYIARTFIMPGQEVRKKTVRLKLNTISSEFEGKNVLLIDDSIVRGTTSNELIQMAREAGALSVIFASAAPPVIFPNVYGIDIPTRQELVAYNKTIEEIQQTLDADVVIYNDLEDVCEAVRSLNRERLNHFEDSCFSGKYITRDIDEDYLDQLEQSKLSGEPAIRVITPKIKTTLNQHTQGFSYFDCPHTPIDQQTKVLSNTSSPKNESNDESLKQVKSSSNLQLGCEELYNDNEC